MSKNSSSRFALFNLGFRPFFLGAGIFSIISISLWSLIYLFQISPTIELVSDSQWHAHEMIYGYGLAVIAGFLLTAIKNWTGIQTAHGKPLMIIFVVWAMARLLFLFGTSYLIFAGIFDGLFILMLIAFTAYPIFKAKQWKQSFILLKLLLLAIGNGLFYLGALEIVNDGIYIGLYGGLYLIIAIILTIGRRVVPFFIERGVGYEIKLFNSKWLDLSSMLLFLGFFISELFLQNPAISAYLALALFFINSARLVGWHSKGIWRKSLLWSLYLSLCLICLGFLLFATTYFFDTEKSLAIHTFSFGGIGLITLAMMSRVSFGHSGRDINQPSNALIYAFCIILLGFLTRVILPLFEIFDYEILIGISLICWLIAFIIFVTIYFPILTRPRVDGREG
ncbi:MAG: NnrS family protein [Proteobacteria bacterium]|nr:NnrS family protein [Pseudomonadota bacterium]